MPLKHPVTLIVGAGASVPYDLPTGEGLVRQIISSHNGNAWSSYSTAYGCSNNREEALRWDDFTQRLRVAAPRSIDTFLAHNAEYADMAKHAIACLISHPVHRALRSVPPAEDWIRWLFDHAYDRHTQTFSPHLSIVTFNYDTLVESICATTLTAGYRMPLLRAQEIVSTLRIVHIYGELSLPWDANQREYQRLPVLEAARIREAAQGIRIIGDRRNDGVVTRAQEFIATAKDVVFLGFSYDPDNMRLILPNGQRARCLNGKRRVLFGGYGVLEAEQARVSRYCLHQGIELSKSGTRTQHEWSHVDEGCRTFLRRVGDFVCW